MTWGSCGVTLWTPSHALKTNLNLKKSQSKYLMVINIQRDHNMKLVMVISGNNFLDIFSCHFLILSTQHKSTNSLFWNTIFIQPAHPINAVIWWRKRAISQVGRNWPIVQLIVQPLRWKEWRKHITISKTKIKRPGKMGLDTIFR